MLRTRCSLIPVLLASLQAVSGGESVPVPWITIGTDQRLVYRRTPAGDRITDFSFAGFRGGGIPLPHVPTGLTLQPGDEEDDSPRIQKALDDLGARADATRPLALVLAPGGYRCRTTLRLNHAGVILRGGGSGDHGTVIALVGPEHAAMEMGLPPPKQPAVAAGASIPITDPYLPNGATTFTLDATAAAGIKAGDTILITRPVTSAWIARMGMDTLTRDGQTLVWLEPGETATYERQVVSRTGNAVTIDVPLTDRFERSLLSPPGPGVAVIRPPERIGMVGVEHLAIRAPRPAKAIYGQPTHAGIRCQGLEDAWIDDVVMTDCEGGLQFRKQTRRMTIRKVVMIHTIAGEPLGPKFADIMPDGEQLLFQSCRVLGDDNRFCFMTGKLVHGPNVVLDLEVTGFGRIEPHMRWATGVLFDNCRLPAGGINLKNRGTMGSGHGWTIGWSVAWNCSAKSFDIQQPPGAFNWAIGCQGAWVEGNPGQDAEAIRSWGTRVVPESLYRAQLAERLGASACAALEDTR